jgi:type IX secretion system PorP/SprF family membrane protein
MKKFLYTLSLLLVVSFAVRAQQLAPFNQYTEYQYLYNPAFVGTDSASSVLMLYRNQWSGLTGAPEQALVFINSKLTNNAGIGGYLIHESANIFGSTGGYLAFSYALQLADKHALGFGLAAGVIQKRILFERIRAQRMDDPALLDGAQNQTKPDGSFGIRYKYADRFELSFSAQQLFGGTFGFVDQSLQRQSGFELLRHYYLTGQYFIPTQAPIGLSVIGTLRSVQGLKGQWDLGVRANWRDQLSTTILYRDNFGLGVMFGVKVMKALQFGYAYEIPSNGIGLMQSQGSHEISLKILFSN